MKVFVDSSVFIRHFYGVEKAVNILDVLLNEHEVFVSANVIEETFFKLLFIECENRFGKTGKYTLREMYKRHADRFENVKLYLENFILEFMRTGIIKLCNTNEEILKMSIEISYRYSLLPNDALIAATCKYHGISKIATFDEDFARVDFLEIVKV